MERRQFIFNSGAFSLAAFPFIDLMSDGKEEDYQNSTFIRAELNKSAPAFDYFSIDSLGKGMLEKNLMLREGRDDDRRFRTVSEKNKVAYFDVSESSEAKPTWELNFSSKSFTIRSRGNIEKPGGNFKFRISHLANHATLLGIIANEEGDISLPAILHFPDMGTLRITSNVSDLKLRYNAKRFIDHPFVNIEFPSVSGKSTDIIYQCEVVAIYPQIPGIENDKRYDCFRRNFISIFQLNPFLKILANNSASDACAFTLYTYATMALHAPQLARGLTALDLLRETLDRYLAGRLGYGQLGYDYEKTYDIPESPTNCNSLDSYPSLLISACYYAIGNRDKKWFINNYEGIKKWVKKMMDSDLDGDGLLEFCLSGNSGSWKGDKSMRPANWWDTIGFGHKDAYSNALAYHALVSLAKATAFCGMTEEVSYYNSRAVKLKELYTKTFFNEKTGVLAGWKSADGKLHDYYFTFVSGVAITYDLIETSVANSIMDKMLAKMKAVGFTNFELGLPGNLIPVIRADYTDLLLEVGGGKREDNLDGFQIYENGGATACFTYFTIHALQKLNRKKDADAILIPLLRSMSAGNFQGTCSNGKTKDWKTWKGECWGYEGFLVDNYLFLLNVLEQRKQKS